MTLLNSLFQHMEWADARVIESIASSPGAADVPNALRWLAHIVGAERVWLLRLRGEDSAAQSIWPEWPLERIRQTAQENARGFAELVQASEADLTRVVEYRNSQGTPFSTAVGDILAHVALHGSYHRGQIAAALRASGIAPVGTDYITYVRDLERERT
jgi:uncharacterized damage-inducible protein DinB